MVRTRPRWQMTTRPRTGAVLAVAGFAVAGAQLALISSPPTVVQIVVVAFWSVVGLAYLASALAQQVRLRRSGAPDPPPVPRMDAADVVPVPVRPARPRPRSDRPAADPSVAEPPVVPRVGRHAAPPDESTPEETTDALTVPAVREAATRPTLSFGPAREATVSPATATAPTAPPAGPRHRAAEVPSASDVPGPRAPRHRAPEETPVLAGRGEHRSGR